MLNNLELIGHIGKAPEITHLPSGTKLAKFSLPLFHSYSPEGKKTEWIDVDVFGKLADIVEARKLQKGARVMVVGELHNPSFQAQDKSTRTKASLKADKVIFLDNKATTGSAPSNASGVQNQQNQQRPQNNSNQQQSNSKPQQNTQSNQQQTPKQQEQEQPSSPNMDDIENFLGSI